MPKRPIDRSPDGLVLAIKRKLKKRGPGRYYIRLSLERWRPLRAAFKAWGNVDDETYAADEADDKMPHEYDGAGVMLCGLRVAIQKSKLSKQLRRQGYQGITFL